jgi:hypothetical protein
MGEQGLEYGPIEECLHCGGSGICRCPCCVGEPRPIERHTDTGSTRCWTKGHGTCVSCNGKGERSYLRKANAEDESVESVEQQPDSAEVHDTCTPAPAGGVICSCGLRYEHITGWKVHRFQLTGIRFDG